jgi:hypothetical protein
MLKNPAMAIIIVKILDFHDTEKSYRFFLTLGNNRLTIGRKGDSPLLFQSN